MNSKRRLVNNGIACALSSALVFSCAPALAFAEAGSAASQVSAEVQASLELIANYRAACGGDAQVAVDYGYDAQITEAASSVTDADYENAGKLDLQVFVLRVQAAVAAVKQADTESQVKAAQDQAAKAKEDAAAAAQQAKADLAVANKKLAAAQKQVESLQSKLETAQEATGSAAAVALKYLSISKLEVTPGMGKASMTWQVSDKVPGIKYQVQYRLDGATKWKEKTVKKLKATVQKLKKDKPYTFRVRAFKTVDDEEVYSKYSAEVKATPLPVYKKGKYAVNMKMGLNVRAKASTTSNVIAALQDTTKVKVTKVLVGKDKNIWGKIKTGGNTGFVQMRYLKKA